MNQKTLYILAFIFLVSVFIFPLSLSNCGLYDFYMAVGCHKLASATCGGLDLNHLNTMRGLLIFGLVVSIIVLIAKVIRRPLFSLLKERLELFFKPFHYLLAEKFSLGRLKPFDSLLKAYASGLIQPKTFCS